VGSGTVEKLAMALEQNVAEQVKVQADQRRPTEDVE
jgi:hypothetical protein